MKKKNLPRSPAPPPPFLPFSSPRYPSADVLLINIKRHLSPGHNILNPDFHLATWASSPTRSPHCLSHFQLLSDYINNMTSAEKECPSAPVFSIKAPTPHPPGPRVVWPAERCGLWYCGLASDLKVPDSLNNCFLSGLSESLPEGLRNSLPLVYIKVYFLSVSYLCVCVCVCVCVCRSCSK